MNLPPVVSREEWNAARAEMLVQEKELTRARDALAAQRRRMPRMRVEQDYRFETRKVEAAYGLRATDYRVGIAETLRAAAV